MLRQALGIVALLQFLVPCGRAQEPAPDEINWVKEHAVVFNTAEAGSGFDDLKPLKELIGTARIVAVGEGTHGTREFFQMKHRLVEFLASEMGFTIFSIEANMPEAYRVNDFVLTGEGDPKKLISGMYFWTWNTQEVLDMVMWMREFNKSGKGQIQFTGFDMQTPDVAAQIVLDYLKKVEPEYGKKAAETYATVNKPATADKGEAFGVATATFPVKPAAGKTIRYSGFIKTRDITRDGAGLWWRVDGESGVLAFDNMQQRSVKGTTDWKRYEIELPVAKEATNINFGAILPGDGTAWFDDLRIEIDGEPYAAEKVADLDFESGTARGFYTGGEGYAVEVDPAEAKSGKHSLRMTHKAKDESKPDEPKLDAKEATKMCRAIVEHFEAQRKDYEKQSSAKDFAWALQNARVVVQCREMFSNDAHRDLSMARNVRWIIEQAPPDAKIVLWAHNGHVTTQKPGLSLGPMGAILRDWYDDKLVVIGFAANAGRYTAMVPKQGLSSDNELQPAAPGSAEYYFHQTGLPRFVLDLRKASADDSASTWLTKTLKFRTIGALAQEMQFFDTVLPKAFDALIYFDETTPSRSLGR